jgi:probable Rubsico expression protein CbbX
MSRQGKSAEQGKGNGEGAEGKTKDAEERLSEDETVDLTLVRKEMGIDRVLDALDRELVGLAPIKARIRQIAALLLVERTRARFGVESTRPTLHMCFTGSPGTGKTTVGMRMAELLKQLGYLRRGHLVNVTRDDLVGQYVGHTAPKTKEVVKRAMGGVLFIDEAYYLYREDNERDYGQESIEILLQVMENNRDDLVVILAGYADRMDAFFKSNPGMSSRIAHHLDFPNYSLTELEQIGQIMLRDLGYTFSEEAEKTFREYLSRRIEQPRFANARSVRNAIERARLRQASRLVEQGSSVGLADLQRIEADDVRASRVFGDQAAEPDQPAEPDDEDGDL